MKRAIPALMAFVLIVFAGFILRRSETRTPTPGPSAVAPRAPAQGPGGSFDIPVVSPRELKQRLDARDPILVVFVGSRKYFEERRIPGALCIDPGAVLEKLSGLRDREIVFYCGCCAGISDGLSGLAAKRLLEAGFPHVAHLEGHFAAWQAAGYPCEGTNPDAPEERAYANEDQKRRLDRFQQETRAQRERSQDLAHFDRTKEIEALRLKRSIAEENGDRAKVAEIDRILRERGR